MSFLTLAQNRYSARKYRSTPVEEEKLLQILEAGRSAPTACNNQPQRILVVQSSEGLSKITKSYKSFGAPLALVICTDTDAAWVRSHDGKTSVDIDAAIVTDHMMLCAADLGLNSVWVCAFNPQILRQELEIPASLEPVNILFIGYADGEPRDIPRHPLAHTVFYERF